MEFWRKMNKLAWGHFIRVKSREEFFRDFTFCLPNSKPVTNFLLKIGNRINMISIHGGGGGVSESDGVSKPGFRSKIESTGT